MAQSHSEDVAFLRAERHPDADLARALGNGVTHDPVDTDSGEKKREPGKQAEQEHAETLSRHRLRNDVGHRPDLRDGLILVHRPDDVAYGRGEAERCDLRTNNERVRREVPHLVIRPVHLQLWLLNEVILANVLHDSDDGAPWNIIGYGAGLKAFADRVLAGPIVGGYFLADHDHRCGTVAVVIGKIAAFHQRNLHRVEIPGTDDTQDDIWALIERWVGQALDSDRKGIAVVGERQIVTDPYRLHAGLSLDLPNHLLEESGALLFRRVFCLGKDDLGGQHVIGIEARIEIAEVDE